MQMSEELYIGVDVSKKWLDLAYYDGVDVDWKQGHIRVDNNQTGFNQIGKWLKKLGMTVNRVLFCMEYTGLYCQELREWLEREGIRIRVHPRGMGQISRRAGAGLSAA